MNKVTIKLFIFFILIQASISHAQDNQRSNGYNLMKEAIKNNNYLSAVELVKQEADLNYFPENRPPLILICIRYNNIEIAELLLNNGISVNQYFQMPDGSEISPFMFALGGYLEGMLEEKDFIELFINYGADINYSMKDEMNIIADRYTPLLLMSGNSEFTDVDLVKLIIEKGADVNHKSTIGFTALMLAIAAENNEIVSLLLKYKANVNAQLIPFAEARELLSDSTNSITLLKLSEGGGGSVLHLAIDGAEIDIIELLLSYNPLINIKNDKGQTPLHKAAYYGYRNLSRINILSEEAKDNYSLVELLLNNNADVNIKDDKGETPLHLAAAEGNSNIVSFLLEHGADPNITSIDNKTPLDLANDNFHEAVSNILRKWDE